MPALAGIISCSFRALGDVMCGGTRPKHWKADPEELQLGGVGTPYRSLSFELGRQEKAVEFRVS